MEKLCQNYIDEIVRLHGVPLAIVSDHDSWFILQYWLGHQEVLGTKLSSSMVFYPQTNVQSERTIQMLEDMLCMCVLDFGGNWERYVSLVEFAYNNSYHASIKMTPFEALYRRPCHSPIFWAKVGDGALLELELVQETTQNVQLIKQRLEIERSLHKNYADAQRRPLAFEVGEHVFF